MVEWAKRLLARFQKEKSLPVIPLEEIVAYDPANRRIVIQGDIEIFTTGTLRLSSNQNVVILSGNRDGDYTHAIHLNPPLENPNAIHLSSDKSGSTQQPNLQSNGGSQGTDASTDNGNHAVR